MIVTRTLLPAVIWNLLIGPAVLGIEPQYHTVAWETAQGTNHVTGATADVAYSHQLWGSQFQVLVDRIPLGTTCQMWVVHPDGTRTQVAAWTTARDEGTVWYWGSMPKTAGPISEFQITAGAKVLVTVTPT